MKGVIVYSDKLAKLFKSKGIAIGDKISISDGKTMLEGDLMPKTEAGDEETVVIKLANGYNAGIRPGKGTAIEKMSSREESTAFPFAKLKEAPNLPKVTILWTGGTIGSKIDYKTSGVSMTVKAEELLYYVPELAKIANISIAHLFSTASEDLTSAEWQRMAGEAAKALNGGARGIVIAHGTDTMHYSSAALSFMLKGLNAPVVLTGAQRSSDRGSSDAFLNLASAVRVAGYSDIAEVCICMHTASSDDEMLLIRGNKARKMHSSRRDAFRPINDKPIARVSRDGDIKYVGDYNKAKSGRHKVDALTKYESKVALVKAYPNSDPGIVDYYVSKGYKGIIIEGTGMGHTPIGTSSKERSWLPHVEAAIKKGVVLGITTQTIYGRVHRNVYRSGRLLDRAGAIYCEDMLPETAYVKLGWLLGNYTKEQAKSLLPKNIAGEIKERSGYDEFMI